MEQVSVCPACQVETEINPSTKKPYNRCRGCGSKRLPILTERKFRIVDGEIVYFDGTKTGTYVVNSYISQDSMIVGSLIVDSQILNKAYIEGSEIRHTLIENSNITGCNLSDSRIMQCDLVNQKNTGLYTMKSQKTDSKLADLDVNASILEYKVSQTDMPLYSGLQMYTEPAETISSEHVVEPVIEPVKNEPTFEPVESTTATKAPTPHNILKIEYNTAERNKEVRVYRGSHVVYTCTDTSKDRINLDYVKKMEDLSGIVISHVEFIFPNNYRYADTVSIVEMADELVSVLDSYSNVKGFTNVAPIPYKRVKTFKIPVESKILKSPSVMKIYESMIAIADLYNSKLTLDTLLYCRDTFSLIDTVAYNFDLGETRTNIKSTFIFVKNIVNEGDIEVLKRMMNIIEVKYL